MTTEEKALEEDYKRYCEMVGDLSNEELNRRYKKYFLQDCLTNYKPTNK